MSYESNAPRAGDPARAADAVKQKIVHVSVTIFAWNGIPKVSYSDRNPDSTGKSEIGLLTIQTDGGIKGHAFLGSSIRGAYLDAVSLMRALVPRLMGQDPLERERLWGDLHSVVRATTMRAIGAVDLALWDIAGKIAQLPVCRLIGLQRTRIPAYASSPVLRDAREYVEQAMWARERGYQAYKIHPPKDLRQAIEVCSKVRAAVGADMRLMVDVGGTFRYTDALRFGRAMEEMDFYWLEDPLAEDDIHNYVSLRQKLEIPIMATEYSPGSFHSYGTWIETRATDYLRGDVAVKGGLTGVLKAATLADAFRMNFEIHHGGNSLNNLAQLHAALTMRNTEYIEVLLPAEAQRYGLLNEPEIDKEGYFVEPRGIGLCAELDESLIAANTIEVLGDR